MFVRSRAWRVWGFFNHFSVLRRPSSRRYATLFFLPFARTSFAPLAALLVDKRIVTCFLLL